MSLESGKYTITSKLDDAPVGRRLEAAHPDTRPRGIFKLPQEMAVHPTIWEVEKLENGNYKFKANHNIVGILDDRLFAILNEGHPPTTTEWTLRRDEWDTERDAYVLLAAGRTGHSKGWTAPEGEDEQIFIGRVLVGRSLPPTYFPQNVFFFKRLD